MVNAKTQRTSVCNAAESLLVHEDVADDFLPGHRRPRAHGVTIHGDPAFAADDDVVPATEEDWAREYLSPDISAAVVVDLEARSSTSARYSSGHSEAIVARDRGDPALRRRGGLRGGLVNASTRFTDGGEFGFGAEIGISTQKLHARGPMGLAELTTTK